MEKSSRRWRSCLVSVCGTRLVNNRLSETCAHHCLSGQNLRGVQASRKRDIPLNYSQAHSRVSSSGTKLLNRGGFQNCPHSVQHQPGRGRIWRELKVTCCNVSAKKGCDARCIPQRTLIELKDAFNGCWEAIYICCCDRFPPSGQMPRSVYVLLAAKLNSCLYP